MPRRNPVSVDILRVRSNDAINARIETVLRHVAQAETARDEWGRQQRKFIRQRYGVRTKPKTSPWKGASNLNIPLIDKAIRRWKPGIVRLVLESNPVAHFNATGAEDQESARLAEQTYDWLFRTHMNTTDEVNYLADILGLRGTGYIEVGWEYRTERRARAVQVASVFPGGIPQLQDPTTGEPIPDENGQPQPDLAQIAETIALQYDLYPDQPDHLKAIRMATEMIVAGVENFRIVYREVVRDRPRIVALDPLQVVVPPRETDISNSRFIAVRHIVSVNDMRRMAKDGILERGGVATVLEKLSQRGEDKANSEGGMMTSSVTGQVEANNVREDRDTLDELVGILNTHEDPETLELWKIFCWIDIDGDGEEERAIVWYHPGTKTRLALMDYTLPFDRWPLVEFAFERTHSKRTLASRGIAQMLSPLQTEVNRLHNNRLDAQAIQLAPVLLVRKTGNTTRQLRMAPGTVFPVQDTSDVAPLVQDLRNLQEYLKEEQFVRLIAEEYIGIFDAALGATGSPNQARTATEIEATIAQTSGIFSLDALLWQLGWGDVHRLIWSLWLEIGPPETTIRVTGEEGVQFVSVRRADVNKAYDIKPAGTPTNTNKALELARAREVMQLLWNPFSVQSGAVQPLGLLNWYVGAHDPKRAKQIVAQDENAMASQQIIMQAAAQIAESQQNGQFDALFSGANQVPGQQAGANAR